MATQAQYRYLESLLKQAGSNKTPTEHVASTTNTNPRHWAEVTVVDASTAIDSLKKSLGLPTARGRKASFEDEDGSVDLKDALNIIAKPSKYATPKPEPHTVTAHATTIPPVDAAAIARAAESVITPRLDQALRNIDAEATRTAALLPNMVDAALSPLRSDLLNLVNAEIRAVSQRIWEEFQPRTIASPPEAEQELDLGSNPDDYRHLIPIVDPNFYFDPDVARAIRTTIKLGSNLYIKGDTGCGKTDLTIQVHAKLSRPMYRVNMHQDVSKETFIGGWTVEGGATVFKYGVVPTAMRAGITVVLDEVDKMPPGLSAVIHSITERRGKLFIPETGETISPHPGFLIIATANTGGKGDGTGVYTGAEVQDSAFLNRFNVITMSYMPADRELTMLQNRFPSTQAPLDSLVKIATEVRAAFSQQQISVTLSTRGLIEAVRWFDEGYTLEEALGVVLTNWLDADDINLVSTIIDRVGVLSSLRKGRVNKGGDYDSSSAVFNDLIKDPSSKIAAVKEQAEVGYRFYAVEAASQTAS